MVFLSHLQRNRGTTPVTKTKPNLANRHLEEQAAVEVGAVQQIASMKMDQWDAQRVEMYGGSGGSVGDCVEGGGDGSAEGVRLRKAQLCGGG
jgi:hypothetical protein